MLEMPPTTTAPETTLDMTERDYVPVSTASAAFGVAALCIGLFVGGVFTLMRYFGVVDWPWLVATAGLWVPIAVVAIIGARGNRRGRNLR